MKWGNEQTDRHTINIKLFQVLYKIPEMSPENIEKISHPELNISKDNPISVRKWGNEETDRHSRYPKLFWIVQIHPRNASQKFEKDSSSRTKDIQR